MRSLLSTVVAIAAFTSLATAMPAHILTHPPTTTSSKAHTTVKPTTTTTSITHTKTKACQSLVTSTAKFDALPTGSSPPANYGGPGLSWSGFTVDSADNYYMNATSGTNIATLPALGATISGTFELMSFTFACVGSVDYEDYYPEGCTIQLISIPPSPGQSIQVLGPWTYDPGNWQDEGAVMKKVVVPGLSGSGELWWTVINGAGSSEMLVDNVVIASQNEAC